MTPLASPVVAKLKYKLVRWGLVTRNILSPPLARILRPVVAKLKYKLVRWGLVTRNILSPPLARILRVPSGIAPTPSPPRWRAHFARAIQNSTHPLPLQGGE